MCYPDKDEGEIKAHGLSNHEKKSQDFVLWPEAFDWEMQDGDEIIVRHGVDGRIDKHIRVLEADLQRMGETHAYGVWRDLGQTPERNMPISWNAESRGVDSTGEPVDYQVTPVIGKKELGIPEETRFVVLNKKERLIVGVFDWPEEA